MRSLVVYESWFGNTRRVAEEIGEALAEEGEVDVVSVDDPLPPLEDVDLLVVGAPTHVHGLSSRSSRRSAIERRGDGGEAGAGARGWIDALPLCGGPAVAVFDTRAHKPALLVGSAARGIARRLRRHGYDLVAEPESFFVSDLSGPLEDGELEHATAWGRRLVHEVMHTAA